MRIGVFGAAVLALLVVVSTADAALCIRLAALPSRPVVGRVTTIEMKTLVPLVGGGLKPRVVERYPFASRPSRRAETRFGSG